jgi:hypothetical protein
MTDYLADRQTAGLGADYAKLNAKLAVLACYFDLNWLESAGDNPLCRYFGRGGMRLQRTNC